MGGEWPGDRLDVRSLVTQGFRPTPFQQFVLKLHSRCDLACDYCYVFEMADQSWRDRAGQMSSEVLQQTCERIAEHVELHQLSRIEVVFHGGEPLLAGADLLARAATALRETLQIRVDLNVQTNAVRLDESMLDILGEHGISVGVSLDGTEQAHDEHRRFADGRGSHDKTLEGIRLLRSAPYRALYSGLLCLVQLNADPIETYEALLAQEPPKVDFLLPHANWSVPPPRGPVAAPYGDWLATVFDRWYDAPSQETEIRLFQEIINLVLGGGSTVESVGLSPVALVVIDTDGSFEQVDSLRSAYDGAAATGFTVFDHSLDDVLTHPAVVARQIGLLALADTCRSCDIRDVCGGGYYPHRYEEGTGFLHPSVYCPDLDRLIRHVAQRLHSDLDTLRDPRP